MERLGGILADFQLHGQVLAWVAPPRKDGQGCELAFQFNSEGRVAGMGEERRSVHVFKFPAGARADHEGLEGGGLENLSLCSESLGQSQKISGTSFPYAATEK